MKNKYIFITGRQKELSVAELYGRYSDAVFRSVLDRYILFETEAVIDQKEFDCIGGSLKVALVAGMSVKERLVLDIAEKLADSYSGSKLDYGISVYGISEKQLRPILLKLKKKLKEMGVKSRFINKAFCNITSAQYKSIKEKGVELLVVKDSNRFLICEVIGVQDIDAYSKRDYEKPFRDMQMGMMPPKLAQIFINLTGSKGKIWDPFCGSGTLVMEGVLMGREMIGSDISVERIEGAKGNLSWLIKNYELFILRRNTTENGRIKNYSFFVHDATEAFGEKFDVVAFEGDLGVPHNQRINPDKLKKIIADLSDLYVRFFENLKNMKFKGSIVAGFPFFRLADGREMDLSTAISQIEKMGYNKKRLFPEVYKANDPYCLKYLREGQAVGRMVIRFKMN